MDFSRISQWIFSGIFRHNFTFQRHVPKDCHLFSVCLLELSNGFQWHFPGGFHVWYIWLGNMLPRWLQTNLPFPSSLPFHSLPFPSPPLPFSPETPGLRIQRQAHTQLRSWVALLVWRYLSNAASFVFYGITGLIRLIEFAVWFATFEEKCVRQVVLDKWFPLAHTQLGSQGFARGPGWPWHPYRCLWKKHSSGE